MGRSKKMDLRNPATVELIINKMLSKHNVDMKYVMAHPIIDGLDWFQRFTFTRLEADLFKEWFVAFIRNKCSNSMNKKMAEREYLWFDLMYGLKIKEDENLHN